MLLAELNVRHTRRHMPTRRVALDGAYLPASGPAHGIALLGELEQYQQQLEELRQALTAGDAVRLQEVFDEARTVRRAWAEGKLS